MRARRGLVLVGFAVTMTGCATTGTQPSTTGTVTTRCKEIDLSNVSVDPTPLSSWEPKPLAPGFLHVHYSWPATGDGPVYAVGILYENLEKQTVAFFVGPLPGFPAGWPDATKGEAPPDATNQWKAFFTKLRAASQNARLGAGVCGGQGCGKPPDSPPPEFLGAGSSGSTGGISALPRVQDQRYAQVTRSREVVSDAVLGATSNRADREKAIKDLVRNTCHGVQALLGNE
jgi:hypothetical protein